jgi:tRNA dimethylallyltransferase
VARALEVVRATGTPLARWQERREGGIGPEVRLLPLILLPPRQWLHARCDARFEIMMGAAGQDEVKRLLARGLDPELPVMRAIGVREIAAFLAGELGIEQAMNDGRAATRRYAKRQYTWFHHQPPADWPRLETAMETADDLAQGLAALESRLQSAAADPSREAPVAAREA